MKKIFFCLFIINTFITLFILCNKPVYAAGGTVVQIGDSLTAGMYTAGIRDKFQTAGWEAIIPGDNVNGIGDCSTGFVAGYPCHAVAAGPSPNGLEIVDKVSVGIQKANAVVIELGTNALEPGGAEGFRNAMNQMLDKIRAINPSVKIYWVNLVVIHDHPDVDTYSARNKVISEVASAKNVIVIDWFHQVYPSGDPTNIKASSKENESWFQPGGIHYTPDGYAALVKLVVSSVTTGSSGTSSTAPATGTTTATACFMTKVGAPSGSPPPLPADCNTSSGGGSSPSVDASDCPIPGGFISCGSLYTPVTTGGFATCGHCGPTYPADSYAANCTQDWAIGTMHAIDVAKAPGVPVAGEPVYLPKVNGHIVQWTWIYKDHDDSASDQQIQGYSGIDTITKATYYLQFHHTQPGSGNQGTHMSGEVGAHIWSGGDHVHVQIGSGSALDPNLWLDAAQYFCKQS